MKACPLTDGGPGAGKEADWPPHAAEAHGELARLQQPLQWHSVTRLPSGHALFMKQGCVVSRLLFLVGEQYIFSKY